MTHRLLLIVGTAALTTLLTLSLVGTALFFGRDQIVAALGLASTVERAVTGTDVLTADVVERSLPAVVSIVVIGEVPILEQYYEEWGSPFGGLFPGFTIPRQRQVGTEERELGGGSGFFVSDDGYIVTNRHVVASDDVRYEVVTNDGERLEADVVARDPQLDIAIIKVEPPSPVHYLEFGDDSAVRLGEPVIAIGNALAEFPNTVSVGVISGKARHITAFDGNQAEDLDGLLQTDAAINRGNSGGPLLDRHGRVIGVNVAVAGNSENIGFALPSGIVAAVFESVAETGSIVRPFLGVRYLVLDEEIAARNDLEITEGVLIARGETIADLAVQPGSPADRAGLRENDIIQKIDDTTLTAERSLPSVLRQYQPGDTVTLTIWRAGETFTVDVTLGTADES